MLKQQQKSLLNCGYLQSIIDKLVFIAKLQGPAIYLWSYSATQTLVG